MKGQKGEIRATKASSRGTRFLFNGITSFPRFPRFFPFFPLFCASLELACLPPCFVSPPCLFVPRGRMCPEYRTFPKKRRERKKEGESEKIGRGYTKTFPTSQFCSVRETAKRERWGRKLSGLSGNSDCESSRSQCVCRAQVLCGVLCCGPEVADLLDVTIMLRPDVP